METKPGSKEAAMIECSNDRYFIKLHAYGKFRLVKLHFLKGEILHACFMLCLGAVLCWEKPCYFIEFHCEYTPF